MGKYVAENAVKQLIKCNKLINKAKVGILGITFKENCPDIRNTKVVDIYHTLCSYSSRITVLDPWVDGQQAYSEYGIEVVDSIKAEDRYDAAIMAVAHRQFLDVDWRQYVPQPGVLYDVKGVLPRDIVDARL